MFGATQQTVPLGDAFVRGIGGAPPHPDTPALLLQCVQMQSSGLPLPLPGDALSGADRTSLCRLMRNHRDRHWKALGSMHPPDEDRDEEERLCGLMTEYINEHVIMKLLWPDTWPLIQQLCPGLSRGAAWQMLRATTLHTCIKPSYVTMAAAAADEAGLEPARKKARQSTGDGGGDGDGDDSSSCSSGPDDERIGPDAAFCRNVDVPEGMVEVKSCNGIAICMVTEGGGQNLHTRRSPVPKGYSGGGAELQYDSVLALSERRPAAPMARNGKVTVRSVDQHWAQRIANSVGGTQQVIEPTGQYYPARVSIQPAASGGGGPRTRYIALGAAVHSFARGPLQCPLRVLMLALNSLGCTGVDGEMPKNGVNRRQYVSVNAMLMVLTDLVAQASLVQPPGVDAAAAQECWASWATRAAEVAKPRMKGGTLDLVMRSLKMMEWANYNVDANIDAIAKLATPHLDRVAQLLTYPIVNSENPGAALGLVAGSGSWSGVVDAFLGTNDHWGTAEHANQTAVQIMMTNEGRSPAAAVRNAAIAAARRLVLHVVTHAPGGGVWGTFCAVLHELKAHGVFLNSAVWPLVDAESGLHPLLTIVCEEACRLGLVESNYMLSLLSVNSVDEGTVYSVFIVPGTATTLLAVRGLEWSGPPGIVRTKTKIVLNSPGGGDLPPLVALKAARPAPWPDDVSAATTSAILSACGYNGFCFRAKSLDASYCSAETAVANRAKLNDPLADLKLSPWRLDADQLLVRQAVVNGDLDTICPSLGRVTLDNASYEQVFVERSCATGLPEATRLVIVPLVTAKTGGPAKVTGLYQVYRRLSTEYYEQYRGTPELLADVLEAVRAQCGDDAPIAARKAAFREHFVDRFFSDSVAHCSVSPEGAGGGTEIGLDESMFDDSDEGPMGKKIKAVSKSVGASIISALRQTGTLPKLLKHLAWQARLNEGFENLPEAIDRGIAGAAHVLCGVMGLTTYGDRGAAGGLCQAERSMIARRAEVNMLRQSIMHNAAEIAAAKNEREQCMIKQQAAISNLTHEIGSWIEPMGANATLAAPPPPPCALPPPSVATALDMATRAQKQFETASATASLLDALLDE